MNRFFIERITAFILSFIFSSISSIYGQKIAYDKLENYRLDYANTVICFFQDDLGMIWIGSDKGLFSYDGYHSHPHFKFGDATNTRIYCGLAASNKYLYLGTDNGLLVYNYKEDCYENLPVTFTKRVQHILQQEHTLWLGTIDGLYFFDTETKSLTRYSGWLPHQSIYTLLHTSDGQIYVGTYNGLCKYESENETFRTIALPDDSLNKNQFINAIKEDKGRKCVWVGTEGYLYKINSENGSIDEVEYLRGNSVKSLEVDGDGNLLVGTDNGLFVYNGKTAPQHLLHDSRNNYSIPSDIIWDIFSDSNHNIWLGTGYGYSLSYFDRAIDYIPIAQITGRGDGNHFFTIHKDSKGYYWLGGTNGLLRTQELKGVDNTGILWYKMGDANFPLLHNRIRCTYEDTEGDFWIATDAGVCRYDYNTRKFVRYHIIDQSGKYNCNWAYYITEDDNGKLWVASCMGGIFVLDKRQFDEAKERKTIIAEYNYSTENGLSGMFVSQIFPDKKGNMWVLIYNSGLDKIDLQSRKVTRYPLPQQVDGEHPEIMFCDKEGIVWLGYRGKTIRVDAQGSNLKTFDFDSSKEVGVLCIFEVGDNIWLCTTNGFWMIDKVSLNFRRINLTDKCFFSAYYDEKAQKIYLGGFDEIAVTTPEKLMMNERKKPVSATNLYINNQLFIPKGKSIRYLNTLDLNYNQNNVTLEFSDFPYSQGEKNTFVYRLEGLESYFNELPPGTNKLSYNNLLPGRYRLTINRKGDAGNNPESTYILQIQVRPPWYATAWAKLIYGLLFAGLVIWCINFFRMRHRLKLERLEKEKIMEQVKQKINLYGNLSHELKAPLSLIMASLSKLLPEMKETPEKTVLEGVQGNVHRLSALIHQILDFEYVGSTESMLVVSKVEFIGFARSLLKMFKEGEGEKLNYVLDTKLEKIYLDIDITKWESILVNLLSNATKYTATGGTVTLAIETDGLNLSICVSDTGVGIPQEDIPYVFQRYFQSSRTKGRKEGSGIGLYLVKEYVELHGGNVLLTSTEDEGTQVHIMIPYTTTCLAVEETAAQSVPNEKGEELPHVLIVDDTIEIGDCIKGILGENYQYTIAHNGKEGLDCCLKQKPDIIITDLMMPVMDGMKMCRLIREQFPLEVIPIIMLTAKSDKLTELESAQNRIDVFLTKPFDSTILLARVKQLLTDKKMLQTKVQLDILTTPQTVYEEAVSADEKFLSELTRIIENRIDDSDLNVNAVCSLLGISYKQAYRKMKQLTGMTLVEYICLIRLKKAAVLLSKQIFTVSEVMYMVGFSNASYFAKCFQNEFGCTPKQYMNKERKQ